jgi:phospholipid/cholesterol/gamma-HCH transport system substrate-binding protein
VRHLPRSAWKLAVFAAVCLVLLGGLAVKIGNVSLFSSRRTIYAALSDVTGLTTGDAVEIAGVPIGQVSGIAVQRGHAVVTMSIDRSVRLWSGTDVGLRWKNVIGQKVVYLYPSQNGAPLPAGAVLPLDHDVTDASVNALLNSLGPFLQSINPHQGNEFVRSLSGAIEGDTAQIDQLLNSGAIVSQTVGSLDQQVGAVIDNLDKVLTAIASRSGDLATLVDNLQSLSGSLAAHNTLLDQVVGNLSAVSGDLAALIGTNRSNLDQTISSLNSVLGTLNQNQADLSKSLSGLGEGLAPYTEISGWGQWFQIQTVYTCLAGGSACTYYQPTNPPAGSGPGGSPSGSSPLNSLGGAGTSPSGGVGGILQSVAGSGSSSGSGQ